MHGMVNLTRWYVTAGVAPALALFYYLFSLVRLYRRLPEQVPSHFDLDGTPNGWMPRPVLAVFSIVSLAALIAGLLFATVPGPWHITTLMYWGATGLVAGTFCEINLSAAENRRYRFWALLWGSSAVLAGGILCTLALAFWWRVPR